MGGGARRRSRGGEGGRRRRRRREEIRGERRRTNGERERPAPRGTAPGRRRRLPLVHLERQHRRERALSRSVPRAEGESRSQPTSPTRSSRSNSKAMSPLWRPFGEEAKRRTRSRRAIEPLIALEVVVFATPRIRVEVAGTGRDASAARGASQGEGKQRVPRQGGTRRPRQQYSAGLAEKFDDDGFRAILHANRAAALQAMRQYVDAVMDCCASNLLDGTYLRALQRRAGCVPVHGGLAQRGEGPRHH